MNIGSYTREELIEIGRQLLNADTEDESEKFYRLFKQQFNHPDAANLFYYPENYNARKGNMSNYQPSVEEVVDIAISYQAIQL